VLLVSKRKSNLHITIHAVLNFDDCSDRCRLATGERPATCPGLARLSRPRPPSDGLFLNLVRMIHAGSLNIATSSVTQSSTVSYLGASQFDNVSHGGSHHPIFFRSQPSLLPPCLKQTTLNRHLCCLVYPLPLSTYMTSFHQIRKNTLLRLFRGMVSCRVGPLAVFHLTLGVLTFFFCFLQTSYLGVLFLPCLRWRRI
jgi:hypothetical protein